MADALTRVQRLFFTVRHLQPRQAFYFAWRRGLGARRAPDRNVPIAPRPGALPQELHFASATGPEGDLEFTFLNHTRRFTRAAMDWRPAQTQRLWRYNLHYFDFLAEPARSLAEKRALIDDWIGANPAGSEPAWEPYTASLRIVNWCRFFASLAPQPLPPVWLASLHQQARWLERNLELHILANHYFENLKALLFAGAFFDDECARRWLHYGARELRMQLREQFLPDGGHYERTPQYHCILLEDMLDLFSLAQHAASPLHADLRDELLATIGPALVALAALRTPDDDIPQFNDSASGAVHPDALLARAGRLGFAVERTQPDTGTLIDLPDTGLFGWKNRHHYFLIDCGDIGPDYQPGHTHCDFLSYVLMVDGRWLVVDTGVFEYEPGEMRHYVRTTAAHNTVTMAGKEQSEVWGEFRVGRRARRLTAGIAGSAGEVVFEGAYRGFSGIRGGIEHRRRAVLAIGNDNGAIRQLDIEDLLAGSGSAPARSYLHLHPDLEAAVDGDAVIIRRDGTPVATLYAVGVAAISLESGWHCPQFGVRQRNVVIVLECAGTLPLRFGYRLEVAV